MPKQTFFLSCKLFGFNKVFARPLPSKSKCKPTFEAIRAAPEAKNVFVALPAEGRLLAAHFSEESGN